MPTGAKVNIVVEDETPSGCLEDVRVKLDVFWKSLAI